MSKKTLLISTEAYAMLGGRLEAIAREVGQPVQFLLDQERGPAIPVGGVDAAFFNRDIYQGSTRAVLSARAQHFFDLLENSPKLQWLHVFSSGADRAQYKPMLANGVKISTSAGGNAQSVATLAMAGILALNKKLPKHWRHQQQRYWDIPTPDAFPDSLAGQTAVIVGTGHIGCLIARYLRVFEVRVVGINRSGRTVAEFDQTLAASALREQAAQADWLVVCCPLTEDTRHLIDATVLNALPPHAHLVNVGRGAIVDQAALVSSLRCGRIAGAYLDVFDPEPLPVDAELWQLDNVLVTPHAGAHSKDIEKRVSEMFVKNFRNWLLNQPLLNEVA